MAQKRRSRRLKRKLKPFFYCSVCKGYFEKRDHFHLEKGKMERRNIYLTKLTDKKEIIMHLWRFGSAFQEIVQISSGKTTVPLKTFNGLKPKKMISNLVVDFLANHYMKLCQNKEIVFFSSSSLIASPIQSEKKIFKLLEGSKTVLLPILIDVHWFLVMVSKEKVRIYDSIKRPRAYYGNIDLIQAFNLAPEMKKFEIVENYPQQLSKSNDCGIIMLLAIRAIALNPSLINDENPEWGFDEKRTSEKRLEFAEVFFEFAQLNEKIVTLPKEESKDETQNDGKEEKEKEAQQKMMAQEKKLQL